jgi:glycerophosphoryl diester phosphodiesterase
MASPERPLLLGHRGARRTERENTMRAFEAALQHGCDGIEFDVRVSGDGEAVVVHDANICGVRVSQSSRRELEHAAGHAIPSLQQVCTELGNRAYLYIELKEAGTEALAAEAISLAKLERERFVVASFLPKVIEEMDRVAPGVSLGYICDKRELLSRWRTLPINHVMPHVWLANADLVNMLHAEGKKVMVWTVNHEDRMAQLTAMGVDGIVSDDTALLCRTLGFDRYKP